MKESVSFYLASGERHPDEEKLQQSALPQLILEQLQKHDKALGKNRTVELRLMDDGENMTLNLRIIDEPWSHLYEAQISLEALTAPALPEEFTQDMTEFFNQAAVEAALSRE